MLVAISAVISFLRSKCQTFLKNKDSIIFIFESTSVIRRLPFYLQTYER